MIFYNIRKEDIATVEIMLILENESVFKDNKVIYLNT